MSFRIDFDLSGSPIVLRVAGRLEGDDAARVLREQIQAARGHDTNVIVDVERVSSYDDAVLAVIGATWRGRTRFEGGGGYLTALLDRAARSGENS